MKKRAIPELVMAVLAEATAVGRLVYLPRQLDRDLYEQVDKVLKALGGRWSRRDGAHLFEEEAGPLLTEALSAAGYVSPADCGQFMTPPGLAAEVIGLAQLGFALPILEPSAGTGNLARPLADIAGDEYLTLVERDPKLAARLREERGWRVVEADFLTLDEHAIGTFGLIVMNPPFARGQDAAHLLHAWKLLRPGGRLVAVASSGLIHRERYNVRWLRGLIEEHGDYRLNPEDAFKAAGTAVSTVTVVLDKPEGRRAPPQTRPKPDYGPLFAGLE